MVRIRLRREGKRKQPFYRVVVADARSPRDGGFIEIIGQYNPMTNPSEINLDADKALNWLRNGAKPSESVTALLKRTGIWSTFVADKGPAPKRVKKHPKGPPPPKAKAEPEPEPAPVAEAEAPAAEEAQQEEAPE